MRQIKNGSRSRHSEYASIKNTLEEASAQLATLRGLRQAIKQERRILKRVQAAATEREMMAEVTSSKPPARSQIQFVH
jgi:hypothetical protein